MRKLVIIIPLLFVSCKSGSYLDEYAENRILWHQQDIVSYQYNYLTECFGCILDEVIVVVTNNSVTQVLDTETEEELLINVDGDMIPVLTAMPDSFYTIDDLFLRIKRPIEQRAYIVEVEYNSVYGYPQNAYIDNSKNTADDEIRYLLHSLVVN